MQSDYLTEESLKNYYLPYIFPDHKFEHNKIVPNSGVNFRPDFRCDDLKLIIEFDGYRHYSQCKTIVNDWLKKTFFSEEMDYKIIRIPYFVQMSSQMVKFWFGKNVEIEQKYPHGFIDKKALLPADFCYLGNERFDEELSDELPNKVVNSIIESLKNKIEELKYIRLVIPTQLEHLLKLKT